MADNTPFGDWGHDGRDAERAAVLAEVGLIGELIVEVIGQNPDIVWELSCIERTWQDVFNEISENDLVPGSADGAASIHSNLVDGLEPESAFDLWYEALALRIRRCTAWVAVTSGMDEVVLDELVGIEERYAAVLMHALVAPMFRPAR